MRKWDGVTAGRRHAPLLLYHSLSHVCTPPHRLVLRNRTRGWKHKTCEATESAICDISLPRVAGARAGRGAGDEVTLFRHFAAVEGEEENRKKLNAVPHARERAPPRIDQASSPGNRSASSPRTMKQDVAALAAIVHARQQQPCIESKSVQHGLREQQSTRCELMSGASIDSTQRCHTRAKLCPLPTRDGALAVEKPSLPGG